jgi:hypothetical protein
MSLEAQHGIIKSAGWVKKRGKETFQAVVEYPAGPPPGMLMSLVFDKPPVQIVTVSELADLRVMADAKPTP